MILQDQENLIVDEDLEDYTRISMSEISDVLNDLVEKGLISRPESDIAELSDAGKDYDLLHDESIEEEMNSAPQIMRTIINYVQEHPGRIIPISILTDQFGFSPDEIEEALKRFDHLGYPIRKRIQD